MVEDSVTDGKRIGQLLASELTGLEAGVLADVAIEDADPDVSPTPEGAFAYAIVYRDSQIGSVTIYPDHARVSLRTDQAAGSNLPAGSEESALEDASIPVETTEDERHVDVESGVAVKRAVDVIREVLTDRA